ncbi:hypothetical protein ACS64U_003480 [Pseudomonas aeruginosa]
MTKANECTCPSGDGSLRHPCPAHPASVELAGVGAKLTFINGRPAMCGCQVEYSSGGGEYSDVIDVTLCAKHSGSAILDLVATNRIALTPEYEGQWHADFYLDREIPLAKAEGATPAEAVLALMSAERIDPEQESVEQAEVKRLREAYEWGYDDGQNNPNGYSDKKERDACVNKLLKQPSLAQAEAARLREENANLILTCASLDSEKREMQHKWDAIIAERDAALTRVAELEQKSAGSWTVDTSCGRPILMYEGCSVIEDQTAYEVIRMIKWIGELERQKPVATVAKVPGEDWNSLDFHRDLQDMQPGTKLYAAPVAQAQHSVPEGWMLVPVEQLLNMMSDKDHDTRIMAERQLLAVLAAAPGKEVGHE